MFLWAFLVVLLCSASGWNMLLQFPEDVLARGLAGFYIVFLTVILRAIWQCSRRIRDLERQNP